MIVDLSIYAREVDRYNELRDQLIKSSRDVLKAAKQLIYALHRNDDLATYMQSLEQAKQSLDAIAAKDQGLLEEGSYSEANQEYVEAAVFHGLLTKRALIIKPNTVSIKDYLMGLCDVCGELSRHVVHLAIAGKKEDVTFFHDIVESLHGEFLQFNLRNGQLRQKYDSIKYHLKTIEGVLYDLSLKK